MLRNPACLPEPTACEALGFLPKHDGEKCSPRAADAGKLKKVQMKFEEFEVKSFTQKRPDSKHSWIPFPKKYFLQNKSGSATYSEKRKIEML